MGYFESMIVRHSRSVNELHDLVNMTFAESRRQGTSRQKWQDACANFHRFRTEVNDFLEMISVHAIESDASLREFLFEYISVDPIYFRSGYEKERILQLLKRVDLTDNEKDVLRTTILRRVHRVALREFRRFCRLIPQIATDTFIDELVRASRSRDPNVRRRAIFALDYVPARSDAGTT